MATTAYEVENMNRRLSCSEEDISKKNDFISFIYKSSMLLLDLNVDKIQFRTIVKDFDNKEYPRYLETYKNIFGSPQKAPKPLTRDFYETIQYFQDTQPKKRLFCRYKNYYLVKKSFTEGVQCVKPGEFHVYKAIARPIDIYTIDGFDLESMTFRSNYACTTQQRIPPGETVTISPNKYYVLIAPCHAYFKKIQKQISEFENPSEIYPSLAVETVFQARSIVEDGSGSTSNEGRHQIEGFSMLNRSNLSPPSGLLDDEPGDSRTSMEIECINDSGVANGSSNRSDKKAKRMRLDTSSPRPSTSQMQLTSICNYERNQIDNIQSTNNTIVKDHFPPGLAIRKDSNIESYCLRSDSTFKILPGGDISGKFTIENDDMDPYVIEYHADKKFIREIAMFKNGSTFETTLAVQNDLLYELKTSLKKKEKVVVKYFFEFAFKTIEDTYKKFCEMRNLGMIGSCVPAIVPRRHAVLTGTVPKAYETKE